MKKRYAFVGIAILLVGFIYGTVFNFSLQENALIALSIMQGIFVGTLSLVFFCIVHLGIFLFYDLYNVTFDKATKFFLSFWKILAVLLLTNGFESYITNYWSISLTSFHASQLFVSSLIYSIIIVCIGSHYGKIVRRNCKK